MLLEAMAPPQSGSVSMPLILATTKGRTDAQSLTHEIMWVPENYVAAGAMQIRVACAATWDHVDI